MITNIELADLGPKMTLLDLGFRFIMCDKHSVLVGKGEI